MKKVEVIVSEGGTRLFEANDGFIVYGAILKADEERVLIGNETTVLKYSLEEPTAYSNFEFLDAVCIHPDIVYKWWQSRQQSGSRQDRIKFQAGDQVREPDYWVLNSVEQGIIDG